MTEPKTAKPEPKVKGVQFERYIRVNPDGSVQSLKYRECMGAVFNERPA